MIRAAIVDDERYALESLERLLSLFEEIEVCGSFKSSMEFLHYVNENVVDAVFLDVEMPEMNGIELSRELVSRNSEIEIVFVTAHSHYAVEAFRINAVDYLLKPVSRKRLNVTVERILNIFLEKRLQKKRVPYIQCFSEFVVYVNNQPVLWKNTKAKEVMAYLVHKQGAAQQWENIASAVWPEAEKDKAHANFNVTMYLLRQTLKKYNISDIVECKYGNYRILEDKVSCDITRFEKIAKEIIRGKGESDDKYDLVILYKGGYMEENGYQWAYGRAARIDLYFQELKSKNFECEKK